MVFLNSVVVRRFKTQDADQPPATDEVEEAGFATDQPAATDEVEEAGFASDK